MTDYCDNDVLHGMSYLVGQTWHCGRSCADNPDSSLMHGSDEVIVSACRNVRPAFIGWHVGFTAFHVVMECCMM